MTDLAQALPKLTFMELARLRFATGISYQTVHSPEEAAEFANLYAKLGGTRLDTFYPRKEQTDD